MKARGLIVVVLLISMLVAVGCQTPGISQEPTIYVASYTANAGKFKSAYLAEDHPDVKAAKLLTNDFLQDTLNQNWESPTAEKPAMINGMRWPDGYTFVANRLSYALHSYEITGIAFTRSIGGENVHAVVRVESVIRFTDATASWLTVNQIALDQDYLFALEITLRRTDTDTWEAGGIYTHPPERI